MSARLIQLLEGLAPGRILVVGDLMVDRYLFGDVERISPEAPVPVLHFLRQELRLGGAGNVAADLAALKADTSLLALVGDDEMGQAARRQLAEAGINRHGDHLIEVTSRPTVCKMRLVGSAQHRHAQTMMRLDFEDSSPIDSGLGARVLDAATAAVQRGGLTAICIEDYGKGLLTEDVCRRLIELARRHRVPVLVDPAAHGSPNGYRRYASATAIKLNRPEAQRGTGLTLGDDSAQWQAAAERLLAELDLEAAVITLDRHGCYLATRDGERRWLKTRARQVFDVTGAGDMVLAMLAAARASGASWTEAVMLANVAAGIEVERFGAVPIQPQEIIHELLAETHEQLGKVRGLAQLLPELQRHRAMGRRIVFTNGCFDLIHLGHVKYFQFAKAQGDLLVVGVNTDDSIRRLKGNKRPIIAQDDRVSVLEELQSIDYLFLFDQDTPLELIGQIRPDVLVKGADYTRQQVVGWDVVESYGGRVALAPLVDGRSTSAVIQRVLAAYQP